MTRFISFRDGAGFNLDRVAKTRVGPITTRGVMPTHFLNERGDDIGSVPEAVDLESLTSPLVPGDGAVVLFVTKKSASVSRTKSENRVRDGGDTIDALLSAPRESSPSTEPVEPELPPTAACLPIVAWRVLRAGAEPVFATPAPSGEPFVMTVGGAIVGMRDPFRRLFRDIDEAVAAVLAEAEARADAVPEAAE